MVLNEKNVRRLLKCLLAVLTLAEGIGYGITAKAPVRENKGGIMAEGQAETDEGSGEIAENSAKHQELKKEDNMADGMDSVEDTEEKNQQGNQSSRRVRQLIP